MKNIKIWVVLTALLAVFSVASCQYLDQESVEAWNGHVVEKEASTDFLLSEYEAIDARVNRGEITLEQAATQKAAARASWEQRKKDSNDRFKEFMASKGKEYLDTGYLLREAPGSIQHGWSVWLATGNIFAAAGAAVLSYMKGKKNTRNMVLTNNKIRDHSREVQGIDGARVELI